MKLYMHRGDSVVNYGGIMRKIKSIFLVLALVGCLVACQQKENQTLDFSLQEEELQETQEESSTIFVHVCGAVQKEGVYELPSGSRVYEALEMAGGFREDAASTEINQAEVLVDAMKIYVPTKEEVLTRQSTTSGKVNLNLASKEELMTLPGVGASKAESILRYREEHGRFQKIEDIMEISGIKEGLFEQIKDLIQV